MTFFRRSPILLCSYPFSLRLISPFYKSTFFPRTKISFTDKPPEKPPNRFASQRENPRAKFVLVASEALLIKRSVGAEEGEARKATGVTLVVA
jgi:hypothetical protein